MTEDLKDILFQSTRRFKTDPFSISYRKSMSFSEFLKDYTLHDSYLRLVFTDEVYWFTLGIIWDVFWNKDKLGWSDKNLDKWPYLFISFPTAYKVTWTMIHGDTTDTILDTSCQRVELDHLEEVLRNSITRISKNRKGNEIALYNTKFECLEGDIIILHEDPVEVFCVNTNGEFVKI